MNLVIFTHPPTLDSTSMPRFARMIGDGMINKGHQVSYWTSPHILGKLPSPPALRKWLGYVDQFVFYPLILKWKTLRNPANTLFVFADQALGIWVPRVIRKPHVVHVHDFMALKSAQGKFRENPTSKSGQIYQNLILKGFSKGSSFISVSKKTQDDLHTFLPGNPQHSIVVYNGLNPIYRPLETSEINLPFDSSEKFVMHIGGTQWYKNREGVIQLYAKWCETYPQTAVNLLIVGSPPTDHQTQLADAVPAPGKVYFLSGVDDVTVCALYNRAECLLFPSLEEGFGWPIVEAMACGTSVITTAQAPMTEVGGDAAFYLKRLTAENLLEWTAEGAALLNKLLTMNAQERSDQRAKNLNHAAKFSAENALEGYENLYSKIVNPVA